MKQQMMYIAFDGKVFENEEDCKRHEGGVKFMQLLDKIENAKRKYDYACDLIQALKSPWGLSEKMSEPTLDNVVYCKTLPRIEKIVALAKVKYVVSVNQPGKLDKLAKIKDIQTYSDIYWKAIQKRKLLLETLAKAKIERKKQFQALNEFRKQLKILEEKEKEKITE